MPTTTKRRRPRGAAWFWKQTDSWYYTPPGTKRRVRLRDENGRPIRGAQNKQSADLSLARIKVAGQWRPTPEVSVESEWLVGTICSEFIQHTEQRASAGAVTTKYREEVVRYLNSLCDYCGALPVSQLKKGHIQHWVETQETWQSPVTRRNAMTIVVAAFYHCQEMYDVPNPLIGLRKPPPRPRLHSFSTQDEESIYSATDEPFRGFLFAAIHTGLRPYCELARLTAADVLETDRGMMWRVFSSKTTKIRKVPVRTEVAKLTRILIREAHDKEGPLFVNSRGRPWKKNAGVARFARIRQKLGWDKHSTKKNYSAYSCRHTFAHRMLAGYWNDGVGCSIEVLAELMGDTPQVAFEHYGREWGQHYQEPLWAAIGVGRKA